jgi:NAD(P)-dependent dehydrogenase (short-subunit alcohol dehydrogenase family)
LDVTQPSTFAGVVRGVVEEAGRIDVLVNNAGVLRAGALEDLSEQAIREVMETNFFGPMLLSRQVLPQMRKQKQGYIIMISSLSGIAGLAGDVAYTGSKFALEGATEALRHEVDRWGIKVALVQAALYATGIFGSSLPKDSALPNDYPADSPYRSLIESKLTELRGKLSEALDPQDVGDLLVTIANSDGNSLRWPADDLSKMVIGALFGKNDAERDRFLRGAAGTDWWSEGKDEPGV